MYNGMDTCLHGSQRSFHSYFKNIREIIKSFICKEAVGLALSHKVKEEKPTEKLFLENTNLS